MSRNRGALPACSAPNPPASVEASDEPRHICYQAQPGLFRYLPDLARAVQSRQRKRVRAGSNALSYPASFSVDDASRELDLPDTREGGRTMPEAALLAAVRAGDDAAARALVERLYPCVAAVVRAHLPRRDDLEDLMQETFLKMFARLDQYRGDVALERWVTRIALNTCLDRLRRQRARPELRCADLSVEDQTFLEGLAEERPQRDADAPRALALWERLLASLPAADAWLLRQIELEERSLAAVCQETGWSAVAARVRLFRARKRLRIAWKKLESPMP